MRKAAQKHWDDVRNLTNKLMKECLADAVEMAEEDSHVPYGECAYLAGKLFDARYTTLTQGFEE